MLAGTGYDYYLSMKLRRKRATIYDLEKHAKLEQNSNGIHKIANGER